MPEDDSELIVTRDGSHTVYSQKFDQHYHNPNGAIAESKYVFFEQTGLLDDLSTQKELCIFEVGFGTGLNLLLLMDFYLEYQSTANINFYSVEGFPISAETAQKLNYNQYLDHANRLPDITEIFRNLGKGINHYTFDNISVHLFNGLFEGLDLENIGAQYIFHDAFSPDVNPDLWTGEVFKKLADFSLPNVILSTYSAASKAQGALAWAGWKVAKTQGALGKREMILASLSEEPLADFNRVNEERLAERYEKGDFN